MQKVFVIASVLGALQEHTDDGVAGEAHATLYSTLTHFA
jgi:hypothetical protein